MKKLCAKLFFFLLFTISGFSQNVTLEKFTSAEMAGELTNERILKIYVPESYKTDSTKVYPLAVILDAEDLFDIYVANSKLFALKDKAPEQIVVGVYQNQRNERKSDCEINISNGLLTETSSKFYKFIRNELLDYVDSKYRISQFKTIVGNTLTANFANYFLVEQDPVFNAYININPSYAEGISGLFQGKMPIIDTGIYYYLSSGDYNGVKRHEAIEKVHYIMNNIENEQLKYKYDDYKHSTKTSSIGQSIPAAMAHIFEMYSSISKEEFKDNIAELSPAEAIAYLEKKYVEIQYLFGANIKIRQRDIFAVESIILDKENGDYLEEYGKMINRLYPESPIGDYYIGQYYETGNDLKRALKYYKNGYAKISSDDPNGDGYYQNVERVLAKTKQKREPLEDETIEESVEEGNGGN
tara:strand:+ start:177695 stop:178933 length:1239 start_codon:yes stop_codon:yes gene_type:complete